MECGDRDKGKQRQHGWISPVGDKIQRQNRCGVEDVAVEREDRNLRPDIDRMAEYIQGIEDGDKIVRVRMKEGVSVARRGNVVEYKQKRNVEEYME